jgi:DNA-binding LacI/PurR family transcriptional regulator
MPKALEKIMDAVDIETFLVCEDEEEGKKLSLKLMQELGFKDISIVFIQHQGPGARVRLRGYIYKPGDKYGWLFYNS